MGCCITFDITASGDGQNSKLSMVEWLNRIRRLFPCKESHFEFQSDGCVARVVERVGSTPHLDVIAAVYYNNIAAI